MGSPGVGDDRRGERRGVVGAQDRGQRVPERGVDQRLVPGGLAQLIGGAPGPGRLADIPDAPSWVGVDEGSDRRDNPRRVQAHPGHVGEDDLPGARRQAVTQEFAGRAGHGDEDRLTAREAGPREREQGGQVLLAAAVQERQVMEAFVAGRCSGHRHAGAGPVGGLAGRVDGTAAWHGHAGRLPLPQRGHLPPSGPGAIGRRSPAQPRSRKCYARARDRVLPHNGEGMHSPAALAGHTIGRCRCPGPRGPFRGRQVGCAPGVVRAPRGQRDRHRQR